MGKNGEAMSLLRKSAILLSGSLAFWACSGDFVTEYQIEEVASLNSSVDSSYAADSIPVEMPDTTASVDVPDTTQPAAPDTVPVVEDAYSRIEKIAIPSFEAVAMPTVERVGPVSQYGQLMSGKNSSGMGRIYGSCKGVADGDEVQVRGMSLYWSLLPQATMFYSDAGISTMVKEMKIELIRAAIGTGEHWGGTPGYLLDADAQLELIDNVVKAAVKNDIYVIIDWHSHTAHEQVEDAYLFFAEMAQKYGKYDNVIFEIFNEPKQIDWELVKKYANAIIGVIRKYSDNLILVGNPNWDQLPSKAIGNEVTDPKHNVAYTFHYYANSHLIISQGKTANRAMAAGLSVFVSEWGTGAASGKGVPDVARNNEWQEWVNENKLSTANWSASKINEGTAAFLSGTTVDSLVYSEAGELVKGYLSTNPDTYTKCSAD